MNKTLLLIIIYLIPCILNSQIEKIFEFKAVLNVNYEKSYGDYLFEYNGEIFTILNHDKEKLNLLNIKTGNKYLYILPDTIPYYEPETFFISNDTLYYFDWRHFHSFSLTEKNIFSRLC